MRGRIGDVATNGRGIQARLSVGTMRIFGYGGSFSVRCGTLPRILTMSASPGVAILIAFGTFVISAVGREPTPAERAAAEAASGFESSRDWFQAALQWENAITGAEHTGDGDRAVAHAARAQHAWEQLPQSAHTWERQAFALGVISKYDLEEGRLVQGRQRNLQGLHLVESCLRQEGWEPKEVSCRSTPPSAGTRKRPPPSRSDRNTRSLPSGDQSGCVS